MLGQLLIKEGKGIGFLAILRPRLENFVRIDADEAIAADRLSGGSALEEEGVV